MRRNVKCPFLKRRTLHDLLRPSSDLPQLSRDKRSRCQQSYEDPANLDIDPDFAPWVYQAGPAHVDAFSTASADSGYDVRAYEQSIAPSMRPDQSRGARAASNPGYRRSPISPARTLPVEFDYLDPEARLPVI